MIHPVLIDTGPLVAILSRKDAAHAICVAELKRLEPPLYTCWPVITEAQWLLRKSLEAQEALFTSFSTGLLEILPLGTEALEWIKKFLRRYRTVGPQLADGALVYLAESKRINRVFTLDRRDFSVYRVRGGRALELLPA